MSELVRAATLTSYVTTMRKLGVDPLPLLKEAGLAPSLTEHPDQLVSARLVVRLLEKSAALANCSSLGVMMAEGRNLADLGAVSLLLSYQPNLRAALSTLSHFRNSINATLVISVEEEGDIAIIRENISLTRPEPMQQAVGLALGVMARLCASVLPDQWRPIAVHFTHPHPGAAELPHYRSVFLCPVEFSSDFNGIVVRRKDLDTANPRADAALADHAQRLIEAIVSPHNRTVAQAVEESIMLLLPSGRANIKNCADKMGVTVRTLQRQLDRDGTSFATLLNQARSHLAEQYLGNPNMRITDVADLLGYSSIGAFTRWHIQNYGIPPRDRRSASTKYNLN